MPPSVNFLRDLLNCCSYVRVTWPNFVAYVTYCFVQVPLMALLCDLKRNLTCVFVTEGFAFVLLRV